MQKNNNNISMTNCHKGGIKIKDTGNNNYVDPFIGVNPFNIVKEKKPQTKTSYNELDLNLENYSREDLFRLFGVLNISLTDEVIKECKKLVLKSHPDKSNLDEKYFIFFSKAYQKLKEIYEFQNKMQRKTIDKNEYFEKSNISILNNTFNKNPELKDTKNFNEWFNTQFDKHKIDDNNDSGYGTWLKSDEDIVFSGNVSKSNINSEIEKRKKNIKELVPYKGIGNYYASTSAIGGSSLIEYDSNFTSGSLFSNDGMNYTDLKQAYVESVIPISEDDFNNSKQFKNVDEYKKHRNDTQTTPLTKEESMRILYNENKQKENESSALAFYYAQQAEKVKLNQDNFWASLKLLN